MLKPWSKRKSTGWDRLNAEALRHEVEYWQNVVQRIEAGEAPALEALLLQLRFGRPRTPDDEFGEPRREVVISIPSPPAEMERWIANGGTVRMKPALPDDREE